MSEQGAQPEKQRSDSLEIQVLQLAKELAIMRHAVCTLIAWIGASAGSPLSVNDCRTLIAMAENNGRAE
jgi:hypothetical protein